MIKNPFLLLVIFSITISCKKAMEEEVKTVAAYTFYVGSYTSDQSEGIYKFEMDSSGTLTNAGLVAKTENPSYLAVTADNKYLLAVNENEAGTMESFNIKEDTLISINRTSTSGIHPCFITTNVNNMILTANYSSGNVALSKLNDKGEILPLLDLQQHEGSDTTDRQEGPHAHSAWFKNNEVISVDLGANELWFSKIVNDKFEFAAQKTLRMAGGAGPRHLAFHPAKEWIYVINELNGTVSQVVKSDSTYSIASTISTLPENTEEKNQSADIHVSADGKFLYASNRGPNTIAIFSIDQQGGGLSSVGFESTRGDWPRNFALSPDDKFLLVANERSDNIVVFERNRETGLLKFVSETEAYTPTCILFN
ncbi:lactonase family protein [Fulvivirga lutimaris]|uniref:lactonase family protein n=1 Tax=Fulvivirga lutimaris TaxID=1819566 RepID=UPI0012BC2212|nr:lactonase family protein [Fulvivirga lutimaris]MTI39408.1 lactonase family protein [Fulvivirga lutimaris]